MKKLIACFCIICLLPVLFACTTDKGKSEATVIDDKLIGAWRDKYGKNHILIFDKNGDLT